MLRLRIGPSPRKLAIVFVTVALAIAAIDLLTQSARYFAFDFPLRLRLDRLFHMGREANIPAWFSTILLFLSAALLALISQVKRALSDPFRAHWLVLACIFLYLCADEAAVIHEEIGSYLGARFPLTIFRYGWIVPGALAVILFAIGYRRFFLALSAKTRHLFLLAAVLFLGGAILVEALALPYENGRLPDFGFAVLVAVEEVMEMIGITVFIYALMNNVYDTLNQAELILCDPRPQHQGSR